MGGVKRKPIKRPNVVSTVPPTLREACIVIEAREVGGYVASPYFPEDLGGGRWQVARVSVFTKKPLPPVVLIRERGKWKCEKAAKTALEPVIDPLTGGEQ